MKTIRPGPFTRARTRAVAFSFVLALLGVSLPLFGQDADTLLKRGTYATGKHDPVTAILEFTRVIQLDSQNALAYENRGDAYEEVGEYDKAIADFDAALLIDSTYVDAYTGRSFTYQLKGDNDRAVADGDQAVRIAPQNAGCYNVRGLAYVAMGNYDRGIADYNQALQIDANYTAVYVNRGDAYAKKGDDDRATADYTRVLELAPDDAETYNDVSWSMATSPEASFHGNKKTMEYAKKACELSDWEEPNFIDTLAAAYADAGDFDNAVKWENEYLKTPYLGASLISDAQKRLALYKAHQPYREKR